MKRMLAPLLAFLTFAALTAPAPAADWSVSSHSCWTSARIGTNASSASKELELVSKRPLGFFSLQFEVSDTTGTISRLVYEVSNDGFYWRTPAGAPNIATAIAAGTTNIYIPAVPLTAWVRFRAHATNDGATVSGRLIYQ